MGGFDIHVNLFAQCYMYAILVYLCSVYISIITVFRLLYKLCGE